MLLIISATGLALACAVVFIVKRTHTRLPKSENSNRGVQDISPRHIRKFVELTNESPGRLNAHDDSRGRGPLEAQRRAAEEARLAAEAETQRQAAAEKLRRKVEAKVEAASELEAERLAEINLSLGGDEGTALCPRCGVKCTQDEIERIFGYRRMRRTTASGVESSVTRRQSYCRRCRTEHITDVLLGRAGRGNDHVPAGDANEDRSGFKSATADAENDLHLAPRTEILTDGNESEARTLEVSKGARVPRQFLPVPRVAPVEVQRSTSQPDGSHTARDRAAPIEVRLMFEKGGFCRVSLLPRRAEGMPTELAVSGSGDPPELIALQDEWYQDVVLQNLGALLREGVEWAGLLPDGHRVRSSLSGRELYVLARHTELNGFVTVPRLTLGEEHVALCIEERLTDVLAAIAMTGSPEPTLFDSDRGIPIGWVGLRGIVPHLPRAALPSSDILNALRPLADVKIALDGGIRIDRQTWLMGFPPIIRLRGDTSTIGVVTIDGREATLSADGEYDVPGSGALGHHLVWCTSSSRTYDIRSGAEDWEPWNAYVWSLGDADVSGVESRPAICGAIVRPPRGARAGGRAIVVPASNPVLIGASPGDIDTCRPRKDLRAGLCVGFPCFEPIWAIPLNAFKCDKRNARVLLIGDPWPVAPGVERPTTGLDTRHSRLRDWTCGIHKWCEAILSAGRKGLQPEPAGSEIVDLWKMYKRSAKSLQRRGR